MNITDILNSQRAYFASGATLSLEFRVNQLKKLKKLLQDYEPALNQALKLDLNKSSVEILLGEFFMINVELEKAIKSLKKWMRPQKVPTPFPLLWPGRSEIYYEPYGSALIIGAWNYPLSLIVLPLISALAAGNCAVVKPSEVAGHTGDILGEMINTHFAKEYVYAVTGGPEKTKDMLKEKFDYIFFTGSTHIGKIVMQAAAMHLTPLTLELGGKSPCIVDKTADLEYAAKRILTGKFFNAGQTCIAPDYIYVHKDQKEELVKKFIKVAQEFYPTLDQYGKIINKNHFERLKKLLNKENILFGGECDPETLKISPTFIDQVSWEDPIMKEEIFGPLLPILTFDSLDEVIEKIKTGEKPLALYFFSKDQANEEKILRNISSGGCSINDCSTHYANSNLPFGGVGNSGMGNYHGEFGFKTFSHAKGVYKKTYLFYPKFTYPPYTEKSLNLLKRLIKFSF